MHLKVRTIIAAVLLLLSASTACGSSNSTDDAGAQKAAEATRPVETTSTPASSEKSASDNRQSGSDFVASRSMEGKVTYNDGSTYKLGLEIGELSRPRDAKALRGFQPAGTACGMSEERDAVLPARVHAVSTTSGFSIYMHSRVGIYSDRSNDDPYMLVVDGDKDSDRGPVCEHANKSLFRVVSEVTFGPVTQGDERTDSFWLMIRDYYSPKYPDGNRERLREIALFFNMIEQGSGKVHLADATGDAYLAGSQLYTEWVLPIVADLDIKGFPGGLGSR